MYKVYYLLMVRRTVRCIADDRAAGRRVPASVWGECEAAAPSGLGGEADTQTGSPHRK